MKIWPSMKVMCMENNTKKPFSTKGALRANEV